MAEYERKIKDVAVIIGKAVMDGSAYQGKGAEHYATQILSLKGIEIRADDQSLPTIYKPNVYTETMRMTERAMLKAGFIKVVPKEE